MQKDIREKNRQYCNLLHQWNDSYETYAKSAGLSYTSLSVLEALYEKKGCTQKELAENCLLPKQTVNAVITSFLKKGWVKLEELPEDRRIKIVHFTGEGKRTAKDLVSRIRESEQEAMEKLSKEQRESLLALTKTYIESCMTAMKKNEL